MSVHLYTSFVVGWYFQLERIQVFFCVVSITRTEFGVEPDLQQQILLQQKNTTL